MGLSRIQARSHELRVFPPDPLTLPDLGVGVWKVGIVEVEIMLYSAERWASLLDKDPLALPFAGGIWGLLQIAYPLEK